MKNKIMQDPREIFGPIAHIYRSYMGFMAKELEAYGIGSVQHDFLVVLYHKDGISQEKLARILNVSKATSTRAIRNLEKEGYVFREKDEKDLRAYKVYLTEKGKEMRTVIFEKLISFNNILFSDFNLEEIETFRLLLQKAVLKFFEPGFEPPSKNPNSMEELPSE